MKTLTICLILLSSCMFRNGVYQDDNLVEEIGEAALNGYLHTDIDFTPSSPEKKPTIKILEHKF